MKGLPTALDSDLLRPLATLELAGAISLATLYASLLQRSAAVWAYTDTHITQTGVTLLLAATFMGLVCEGIGARIESAFDRSVERQPGHQSYTAQRWEFLRVGFRVPPVGQAQLETLILRFRFELGNTVACCFCALGSLGLVLSPLQHAVAFVLILLIGAWLWIEARSTHRRLGELRRELLKGIEIREILEPRSE